jgi:CO dehydrogenase maturation factor
MKLALAGKGGAGKTTLSASIARLIARRGPTVVAIDADSNPNLAAALGAPEVEFKALPISLVSRKLDGPRLTEPVRQVLSTHAVQVNDGVLLLRMGRPEHADEGCMCSMHATVGAVVQDLASVPNTVTVLDLEASPEHLGRGTARNSDLLILVAEPYFRSLEAVRLQARLAAESPIKRMVVVANKIRNDADRHAIEEFCLRERLSMVGAIPWDSAVLDADAARTSLIDFAPGSSAIRAIESVVEFIIESTYSRN